MFLFTIESIRLASFTPEFEHLIELRLIRQRAGNTVEPIRRAGPCNSPFEVRDLLFKRQDPIFYLSLRRHMS